MEGRARPPHPGWVREVELPHDLSELRGPITGRVTLPLGIYWTGPDPQRAEWELSVPQRRARLYEIVLREASLDDQRRLINGSELARLWDVLYLPPHIKLAWQPLVDAARAAA